MTKNFDLFVEKLINSFEELPYTLPYGFWISPKGRVYSVSSMDHYGEANNIINYFEPELKEEFKNSEDISDIRDFLIKKGFLRTVFMGDDLLVDNSYYDYTSHKYVKVKPTNIANRTVRDVALFYKHNVVYTSID